MVQTCSPYVITLAGRLIWYLLWRSVCWSVLCTAVLQMTAITLWKGKANTCTSVTTVQRTLPEQQLGCAHSHSHRRQALPVPPLSPKFCAEDSHYTPLENTQGQEPILSWCSHVNCHVRGQQGMWCARVIVWLQILGEMFWPYGKFFSACVKCTS